MSVLKIESIHKHIPVYLVVIAGICLSILLAVFVENKKEELAISNFNVMADKLSSEISNHFDDSMRAVLHTAAFYYSSEYVSLDEFNRYVNQFYNQYPEIKALEWVPRISLNQRQQHEKLQQNHNSNYMILEKLPDGTTIPADDREYYYPITYIFPMKGNESALGYDIASNPTRKAMLEHSVFYNTIAVSNRIRLVQEESESYAVLVSLPVIDNGQSIKDLNSPKIMGVVLGVFRLNDIFERIIDYSSAKHFDITINEIVNNKPELLFHLRTADLSTQPYTYTNKIRIVNQTWETTIKANPQYFGSSISFESIALLITGLCFTALIAAYIQQIRSSHRQATKISRQLTDEINKRAEYERMLVESNRKLELLSREDPLTKIANRRAFNDYLSSECKRAQRSGLPLSLIIADIDNFKEFNDKYGHVIGDHCLRNVAQVFNTLANRPADLAARYGGEEIAVILPETSEEGAMTIAEIMRNAVLALGITHELSIVNPVVSVSMGVTTIRIASTFSVEEIIKSADEALYKAKHKGKNRIIQTNYNENKLMRKIM